ncbi:MAG TPA: NfeD family protein [Fulvivirga sp.]|nr:NfeD family protein [Fulvivirga sp.]
MSDWISVILLIVAGFALLVIEILFVPGTTVVGVLGLAATVFGLYLGFQYFGSETGWWLTGGASVFFVLTLYYSFKSKTWDKFSLKHTMESKVNEGHTDDIKVGDEGKAISTLKPIGKAKFFNREYEVKTTGNYVDSGTPLRIIKIEINNIIVEPIK